MYIGIDCSCVQHIRFISRPDATSPRRGVRGSRAKVSNRTRIIPKRRRRIRAITYSVTHPPHPHPPHTHIHSGCRTHTTHTYIYVLTKRLHRIYLPLGGIQFLTLTLMYKANLLTFYFKKLNQFQITF